MEVVVNGGEAEENGEYHLVKTVPKGLHCLSMRLTIDYYLRPLEKREFPKKDKLEDPTLYHYALSGDPSDEFASSTFFFPEFMGPIVDAIAVICEKICCGGSQISSEEEGHVLGGIPLPGSDPVEASRRRERGARALEERLASAKARLMKRAIQTM